MTTFTNINDVVYVKHSALGNNQPADQPNVIIIFGWMDAKLDHLYKYTKVYEELYPDSTQILIQSDASLFWSRKRYRKAKLVEIIATVKDLRFLHLRRDQPLPRILFHTFSNGGGLQFTLFCDLLRWFLLRSDVRKPICAFVIDSSPGGEDRESVVHAFTDTIRNSYTRFFLVMFMNMFFLIMQTFGELLGIANPIVAYKNELNRISFTHDSPQPQLVNPWFTLRTPRLYIFSKTDKMVPYREVLEHSEIAKQRGFDVRTEVFEDSPHVAHARTDPERYWAAIRQTWEDALKVDTSV